MSNKPSKTPSAYLTQAILWMDEHKSNSVWVSILMCWLMQAKCKGGSRTAHTDGRDVWINQEWFQSMEVRYRGFIFAHEASHGVLGHGKQMRMMFGAGTKTRAHKRANIAWDAWINCVLEKIFGFRLPDGVYFDSKLPTGEQLFDEHHLFNPDEHDWLWLYQRLHKDSGDGEGFGDGDDVVVSVDPADEAAADMQAARALAQGTQLAMQQQRGTTGGWLERLIGQASKPVQDWRSQLWDMMTAGIPSEWSMRRCNKSYACAGGLVGTVSYPGMGAIVVATDTSGSMSDDVLAQPIAEVNAIFPQCNPEKLYQLWVDADVANVQVLEPGDLFVPEVRGGGGTSFVPAFDWVRDNVLDDDVGVMIYFTDGYGDWCNVDPPDYPVIWFIVAGGNTEDPPFGRVIRMT